MAPESRDATTSSDESNESPGRDFILIHEATSSTNYGAMDMVASSAARLARARGAGELSAFNGDDEPVKGDNGSYRLEIDRGSINIDTGFVMRFVSADLRHLSVFDVCSIPELPSYVLPRSALDSLTPQQRGILEQQGYIRIQAIYDKDSQILEDAKRGWQLPVDDPLDRLMQLTKQMEGRTAPVVSYLVAENGPERWADPGVIAEARGIEEATVREQIEEVNEQLS